MKKKVFTLLTLGFLLSMVCAAAYAQTISFKTGRGAETWGGNITYAELFHSHQVVGGYRQEIYDGLTAEELDGGLPSLPTTLRMYEGCEYTLVIKLPDIMANNPDLVRNRRVNISYPASSRVTIYGPSFFVIEEGEDTYEFPITIGAIAENAPTSNWSISWNVVTLAGHTHNSTDVALGGSQETVWNSGVAIAVPVGLTAATFLRNTPENAGITLLEDAKHWYEYELPAAGRPGKLALNIDYEKSPYNLLVSIDGGFTWVNPREHEFSQAEIARALPTVLVKLYGDPRCPIPLSIEPSNPYAPPVTDLTREVVLRPTVGVNFDPMPGLYRHLSGEDFVFNVNTGGQVFTVHTNRINEDVFYKELEDGTWEITIKNVRTYMTISVELGVGNEAIAGNAVWAGAGQLYITPAAAGSASIYTAAGALVKTVALAAGETGSIALPAGFYVAVVNGKAYKVVVR